MSPMLRCLQSLADWDSKRRAKECGNSHGQCSTNQDVKQRPKDPAKRLLDQPVKSAAPTWLPITALRS